MLEGKIITANGRTRDLEVQRGEGESYPELSRLARSSGLVLRFCTGHRYNIGSYSVPRLRWSPPQPRDTPASVEAGVSPRSLGRAGN